MSFKFNPLSAVKKVCSACVCVFKRERDPTKIVVYAYPKFIFFWPIWLLGFLLWVPTHYAWISPEAAGWTYITALTLVVIALGFELSRDQTIFTLVAVALLWVGGLWLRDVKNVLFLSTIMNTFWELKPAYSPNFGLTISVILSMLGALMFVDTRLNDRWVLSPNSIEHYQFGKKDDSLARGSKTVSYQYPDAAEQMLLLAGTILIFTPDGLRLLRKIENVPFLRLQESRIDSLYDSVAVKGADDIEITDSGHDSHDSHSSQEDDANQLTPEG